MSARSGTDGQATTAERMAHLEPLGAVARRVEDNVGAFVDALLGGRFGLLRRHWQLLRWVGDRTRAPEEDFVADAVPFHTEAEARRIVADLVGHGWLDRGSDGVLCRTPAGDRGFRDMAVAQERTWDVVLGGMSEQDYARTVTALTGIADRLGTAAAALRDDRPAS